MYCECGYNINDKHHQVKNCKIPLNNSIAYSDFTLNELQDNFQLNLEEATDLFSNIEPITISHLLKEYYLEQLNKIMDIMLAIVQFTNCF